MGDFFNSLLEAKVAVLIVHALSCKRAASSGYGLAPSPVLSENRGAIRP